MQLGLLICRPIPHVTGTVADTWVSFSLYVFKNIITEYKIWAMPPLSVLIMLDNQRDITRYQATHGVTFFSLFRFARSLLNRGLLPFQMDDCFEQHCVTNILSLKISTLKENKKHITWEDFCFSFSNISKTT